MSQCDNRIKELLPLYADQELSIEDTRLVDEHVLQCAECLEELHLYQEMHDAFNLSSIKAPKNFHEDLVSKLNLQPVKSKTSLYSRYNKYINVAAMLVFVLILSVVGLTQGNKWSESSEIMQTETTRTEETKTEMSDEFADESKSEAKEDSKMEITMETSTAMIADDKEASKEEVSKEDMEVITEQVVEEAAPSITAITEEELNSDANEAETSFALTSEKPEAKYGEETEAVDYEDQLVSDDAASSQVTSSNLRSSNETIVTTKEAHNQNSETEALTGSGLEEPNSNNSIIYIVLGLIGLSVLASVVYFVRKGKIKN